jgi:hypothetical protein
MEFRREQCWNVIFTGHYGILDPSSDLTRKPVPSTVLRDSKPYTDRFNVEPKNSVIQYCLLV